MITYKYIFLDLDGTILDFHKCERVALQKTFEAHAIGFNDAVFKRYKRINEDLWKRHEEDKIEQEYLLQYRFELLFKAEKIDCTVPRFSEDYLRNLSAEAFLEPYALEILDCLYKQYDLYVVTNGDYDTQMNRIKKANILCYFRDVFVSSEIGYHKPQNEFFDVCCNRARIKDGDRREILLVGDSLSSDILGGRDSGMDTCWYNRIKTDNNADIIPTYEIHSLEELKSYL